MNDSDMFPLNEEQERIKVIKIGIQRALASIDDYEMHLAIEFATSYAETHRYLQTADILDAWRESKNVAHRSVAIKDWRNKWGGFSTRLKSMGMIKPIGRVRCTKIHSHNNSAVHYESMIYTGNEPDLPHAFTHLAELVAQVEGGIKPIKNAIWEAYTQGVEQK